MAGQGNFDFLYNPIKEKMRELVSHINYTTFIEKLVPVDVDGRYIILQAPTESFAKYITGTLAEKMREAIAEANVGITDFRIKVEGQEGYAYNALVVAWREIQSRAAELQQATPEQTSFF